MADQFSKMYDFERVGGDQRTRLAEMLRANALNAPQGQMVGGWYVAPSWTQNLAQLANTALGTYLGNQVDEERKAKTAELLRDLSQGKAIEQTPLTQNFNGLDQRAEGQTPFPQQPQTELQKIAGINQPTGEQSQMNPAMVPQQVQQYRPLTEEEKIGKVMELAQYNPYAANIWSAQDTARQNRLSKAEERELDFQRRKELLQDQIRGRQETQQMILAARQPAAEPLIAVMGKDGNAQLVPRSQAVGMTPFNAQTAGTATGSPGARQREANEAVDIVLQAAPLVRQSTASGIGAGVDWAAGLIGQSPKGADVAAQLKVLGGALVSKMPKMSGPQSDKDVMLYKEMAGKLGDPTVPTSQKEAALQTIYNLNAKYAGLPEQTLSFEPTSVMSGYGAPPAGAVRVKGQ